MLNRIVFGSIIVCLMVAVDHVNATSWFRRMQHNSRMESLSSVEADNPGELVVEMPPLPDYGRHPVSGPFMSPIVLHRPLPATPPPSPVSPHAVGPLAEIGQHMFAFISPIIIPTAPPREVLEELEAQDFACLCEAAHEEENSSREDESDSGSDSSGYEPSSDCEDESPLSQSSLMGRLGNMLFMIGPDYAGSHGDLLEVSGHVVPRFWVKKLSDFFAELKRSNGAKLNQIAARIDDGTMRGYELLACMNPVLAQDFMRAFEIVFGERLDDYPRAVLQAILIAPVVRIGGYGVRTVKQLMALPTVKVHVPCRHRS